MRYQDNNIKFTCIINAKATAPIALNGAFHAMLGLGGQLRPDAAQFLEYPFASGTFTSRISHHPVIVLKARNANPLPIAALAARDSGIDVNVFATSMLGASAQEQLAQTAATPFVEAEIVAVALFGEATAMNAITRRFSAFRAFGMEADHAA